jgi:hypothetical protein
MDDQGTIGASGGMLRVKAIAYWVAVILVIVLALTAGHLMLPLLAAFAAWRYMSNNRWQFNLRGLLIFTTAAAVLMGVLAAVYHQLK